MSDLKHKIESLALAAGVPLPVRSKAERFLRQCAPHHRDREWYKLIEELLSVRAEAGTLLLATEKGLTPLGKLIDACREMLKDINYTRGLAEGSIGKGSGNRMADALDELFSHMNKQP